MNCVIPGANLKIFSKVLQALCRFGEELHIEPYSNYLSLRTVNATKTAYAGIEFALTFFTYYKIEDVPDGDQSLLKCKLPMKAMLNAFKNSSNLEKNVLSCKMKYSLDGENIILKFKNKHDIIKIHILYLLEGETLEELKVPDTFLNALWAASTVYQHALQNFQQSDVELTLEVSPYKLSLKNYMENDMSATMLRSQITVNSTDFTKYSIKDGTSVRFSLKLFRAAITFAEAFHLNVVINFDEGGKPLVILLKNDLTFELKFVLSTLRYDCETQSTIRDLQNTSRQINIQTSIPKETNKRSTITEKRKSTEISEEHLNDLTSALLNDDGCFPEMNQMASPNCKRPHLEVENNKVTNRINIFQRCFDATYNSIRMEDDILAEDSGEECLSDEEMP